MPLRLCNQILLNLNTHLDFTSACYILENLVRNDYITENEKEIIKSAISNKALSSPLKIENIQRYNILKNILIKINERRD